MHKKLYMLCVAAVCSCSLGLDENSTVYVCMGQYAKAYHIDSNCKGLMNCKAEIKTMTLKEAMEDYNRTPCGYCCR